MSRELDLRGMYCPIPVLRTREEFEEVKVGDLITVMADGPAAEEDLRGWAKRAGHEVVDVKRNGDVFSLHKKVSLRGLWEYGSKKSGNERYWIKRE